VPVTAPREEPPYPRQRARALAQRLARRPAAAAALGYALLALVLVAPGLVPGQALSGSDLLWSAAPWHAERPGGVRDLGSNYELADSAVQFQPWLQYARDRLPDVPLWNPYAMGGRPFLANAQSALFSPFTWPSLILPFWWSLAVVAALKAWCCAFGTFLLGRSLGMSGPGAFVAGLAAGFGLWFVTWLSWPLASVWAWLPWLLWLADRVVRRPGIGPVAGLAVVVALQFFGGHPESSFHVLAAAALFALLPLSRVGRRAALPAVGRLAGALVAGALLAAVAILPFAELLGHSADLAAREDRHPVSVGARFVLGLALPEYWGRPTQVVVEPFINARAWYVGALPLLLAGVALLRPSRERIAVAAAAAVALAVATGIEPLFGIVHALPGFGQSHNTRLGVLVALGLALLAGWGLDDLLRGEVRRRRLLAVGLAAAWAAPAVAALARTPLDAGLVDDALAVAWGFATPDAATAVTVLPLAALALWLPLAAAAAALIWRRAGGRLAPGTFATLALVLVAADLLRFGIGQNPAIPVEHAEQPATGAIEYLQGRRPARFAAAGTFSVLPPVPPNVAMRYGLADARSYDYPVERRYAALWRREVAAPDPFGLTPTGATATVTPRSLRALGLLGVADVLQPPDEPVLDDPALEVAYDGPDARVYANSRAVPRAFLVGDQTVVASEAAALDAVTAPGFDPLATAVVERRLDLPGGATGDVELTAVEPERMAATTDARARALLVTADVFLPGWEARIDGREVPLERVDYLLRGVVVPAGRHEVELTYRPWSWTAGWIASLLTALVLAAAVAARRWKSPRR
jgi:hypothetical protein